MPTFKMKSGIMDSDWAGQLSQLWPVKIWSELDTTDSATYNTIETILLKLKY